MSAVARPPLLSRRVPALDALVHPVPVATMLLPFVNDRLLKRAYLKTG